MLKYSESCRDRSAFKLEIHLVNCIHMRALCLSARHIGPCLLLHYATLRLSSIPTDTPNWKWKQYLILGAICPFVSVAVLTGTCPVSSPTHFSPQRTNQQGICLFKLSPCLFSFSFVSVSFIRLSEVCIGLFLSPWPTDCWVTCIKWCCMHESELILPFTLRGKCFCAFEIYKGLFPFSFHS